MKLGLQKWLFQASEEAKEQYYKPIDWFKQNVKCCWNCKHWNKDSSLMGDYKYNFCNGIENPTMTCFDTWCEKYEGFGKEENLLPKIEWEK